MRIAKKGFWPYVLPLPTSKTQQSRLLFSVFKSEASIDLLKCMSLEGETYQKDIIRACHYSNKTVIKWLRLLVEAGVLTEGMKETAARGRRVWAKWYRLTPLGKWMRLLLMTPTEIPRHRIEELIRDSFTLYVKSAAALCKEHGISLSALRTTFEDALSHAGSLPGPTED